MFKGQPKGLYALALSNTGERFGYYTMLAIFLLYLQAKFGFSAAAAGQFYAIFLAAVYFMPVIGGILADKIGYGKCVITGVAVMFLGYACLTVPVSSFESRGLALALMVLALVLIALGTGLFKGNLQVMVGNLYDDPKYSARRDSALASSTWPSTSALCSPQQPLPISSTSGWARAVLSTKPTSLPSHIRFSVAI